MSENGKIKACIFDLDGVIVDTAIYHFKAWRQLANNLGFDFTEKENEKLKGVSRVDSLNLILEWGNCKVDEKGKTLLAAQKNDEYLSYVSNMTSNEILPGVIDLLEELQSKGIGIALGSASKNAMLILKTLKIEHFFTSIIDGNKTVKGKPNPEVFQKAAAELGVQPDQAIVFEDAPKGVDAALNGGFHAVGIGTEEALGHAHIVIPGFENHKFDQICEMLKVIA